MSKTNLLNNCYDKFVTDEIRMSMKRVDILLERQYKEDTFTAGIMYLNGDYFCDTLEDIDRGLKQEFSLAELKELKVNGKTAIPTGRYKVVLTHSPRFKEVLPLLEDVPAYEGIRIHSGNTHKDTEGCIIVGVYADPKSGWIGDSRKTKYELMAILKDADEIWIEIK